VAAVFIYLSFMNFSLFESLEKVIYEIEMRLDTPRNPGENKVAIVNIDDKSIGKLGQWPWPRHIIAEMITILKNNGAKLIGLDMIFTQKGQNPGMEEIRRLYAEILKGKEVHKLGERDTWILAELKKIETRLDDDRVLYQTVKDSGNIILPVVGEFGKYETELVIPTESFLSNSTVKKGNLAIEEWTSVNKLTAPFDELSKSSRGLGHINLSPNKVKTGQE